MPLDRTEFCTDCGDPTGRAGNFHDSIFAVRVDGSKHGPLCDECSKKYDESVLTFE